MFGFWFDYWTGAALFYLAIMAFLDVRGVMMVDARYNYIMIGLTLSLLSHTEGARGLLFMGGLLLSVVVLYAVLGRFKVFGSADLKAFSWIVFGLGVVSYPLVLLFLVSILAFWAFMQLLLKVYGLKRAPFFPAILAAFLVVAVVSL